MGHNIKSTGKTYDATPSYKLIKTMGFGSYTLETAVSDIVDNSIAAEATQIDLFFIWNQDLKNCYVEIRDNGFGMSSDELAKAMIFADKGIDDERTEQDLGKYGLGMKTASFFACDCLTVISKKDGHDITAKRLDQDYVSEHRQWLGQNLDDAPELNDIDLKRGTIVRWDKLKFVDEGENSKVFFLEKVDLIAKHLGEYFHRFLDDKSLVIRINGAKIKSWNPTFSKNLGTSIIEDRKLSYKEGFIHVISYLLPSSLKLSDDETREMYRDDALKYQGFYIYRNNRMLVGGGWLSIPKLNAHQQYNPVRITVDISSKLDSDFKVDFTKSSLKFPKEVENELAKIARHARSKASEAYKNRAKKMSRPGLKTDETVWNITQNKNGVSLRINANHPILKELSYNIDKKQLKLIFKLLETTVPHLKSNIPGTKIEFTEEEMQNLILSHVTEQLEKSRNIKDIYLEMCNMEPFTDYLNVVQSIFEEGGWLHENKKHA